MLGEVGEAKVGYTTHSRLRTGQAEGSKAGGQWSGTEKDKEACLLTFLMGLTICYGY